MPKKTIQTEWHDAFGELDLKLLDMVSLDIDRILSDLILRNMNSHLGIRLVLFQSIHQGGLGSP